MIIPHSRAIGRVAASPPATEGEGECPRGPGARSGGEGPLRTRWAGPPGTARKHLERPSLLAEGEAVGGNGKTCVGGCVSLAKGQPSGLQSVPRLALAPPPPLLRACRGGGGGGGDRVHVPTAASLGVMDGCLLRRGSACTAPSAGSRAQPPTPGAAAAAGSRPQTLAEHGLRVPYPSRWLCVNETRRLWLHPDRWRSCTHVHPVFWPPGLLA